MLGTQKMQSKWGKEYRTVWVTAVPCTAANSPPEKGGKPKSLNLKSVYRLRGTKSVVAKFRNNTQELTNYIHRISLPCLLTATFARSCRPTHYVFARSCKHIVCMDARSRKDTHCVFARSRKDTKRASARSCKHNTHRSRKSMLRVFAGSRKGSIVVLPKSSTSRRPAVANSQWQQIGYS